jgi:hypothetical protein
VNLEEREQGLLRLVESYRETECRALLETAQHDAAELINRSYREERARLHQRVLAERADARERIQAARAERETRERAGGERASARILAIAWPRLEAALRARWQEPSGRQSWVRGVLDQARHLLPRGTWTLRHAPEWPEAEWQTLVAELGAELGDAPRLIADGSLSAGLTVEGAGAVLDGSLEGLLKDRSRIEARLLALMQEVPHP